MRPMKNPFPGMNPYLEADWAETHARLIVYLANYMNRALPDDLRARIDRTVVIDDETPGSRVRPDVHVVVDPLADGGGTAVLAPPPAVTMAQPRVLRFPRLALEAPPQRHIEIVETGGSGRVITVIEILSPANKRPGPDRSAYLIKQDRYLVSAASLVEIDLLRSGMMTVAAPLGAEDLPREKRVFYYASVHRATWPDEFEAYVFPLREPLPAFAIPLRESEPDVALSLQPLIDAAHEDARLGAATYATLPEGPLPDEEATWVEAQLRECGLR
jgi:Protein of unknown function (DUF4058)